MPTGNVLISPFCLWVSLICETYSLDQYKGLMTKSVLECKLFLSPYNIDRNNVVILHCITQNEMITEIIRSKRKLHHNNLTSSHKIIILIIKHTQHPWYSRKVCSSSVFMGGRQRWWIERSLLCWRTLNSVWLCVCLFALVSAPIWKKEYGKETGEQTLYLSEMEAQKRLLRASLEMATPPLPIRPSSSTEGEWSSLSARHHH